jgi:hypothetical protein
MVSIKEMANGYIEQIRYRVQEAQDRLDQLKQHLQECENEIQFGASSSCCNEDTPPNGWGAGDPAPPKADTIDTTPLQIEPLDTENNS